jgi:hypothetical protein
MRNESVGILVLAYVIGFTTAFIAFGLNHNATYSSENVNQKPIVLKDYVPAQTANDIEQSASAVLFNQDGLFAKVGDEEKIISGVLSDGIEPGPGFHVDVPFYEISPSGKFIYYCELEIAEDDTCHEYIYEVSSNSINLIKVNGEMQFGTSTASKFSWLANDFAEYDGFNSVSSDEPWLFID